MGGATAARIVGYHRLARGVKAFASSAQADGLLPRATAHPVGIELADFPRLTRLSSHAEADGGTAHDSEPNESNDFRHGDLVGTGCEERHRPRQWDITGSPGAPNA